MVIRMPLTMMDWVRLKAESFTGLVMEEWNRYLCEFLHDQDVVAKGSVPSHTKEIAQLVISKTLTTSPEEAPVELWGPTEWSQHLANAWFSDGSSTTDETKADGKPRSIDCRRGWGGIEWPLLRKEPQNQPSPIGYKSYN